MDQTESEKYIYDILRESDVWQLKLLLKKIQEDYDNPCEDLQRHCRNVSELESYLKDHSCFYIVENGKVARFREELETGQENATSFFAAKLKAANMPVHFHVLRQHIGKIH